MFVGLVCLQIHISKNDKKGKFAIPIICFVLPILMTAIFIVSGITTTIFTKTDSTNMEIIYDEEYNEDYDVEYKEFSEPASDSVANIIVTALIGIGVIIVAASHPAAITTLIIELVYRSKRNKKASAEEIMDIQNL